MDFAIIDGNTDTTKYPIFGNTNIKYQILIITWHVRSKVWRSVLDEERIYKYFLC